MKTKAQVLKDNGLNIRLANEKDLRSISLAMDEWVLQFMPPQPEAE